MVFDQIIEQDQAKFILSNHIEADRIGHAYLFIGIKGIGKKATAMAFAQSIICGTGGCGHCPVCLSIKSLMHPDVFLVETDKKTLGVAKIRELRQQVFLPPTSSDRKIYIIEKASSMTREAQNAFLKVLEEPPEYAIFILLVENKAQMLATVVSRCQQVRFSPLTQQRIRAEILRRGMAQEEAELAAYLAQGSLGKAINMIDNIDVNFLKDLVERTIQAVAKQDTYQLLMVAAEIAKTTDETISYYLDYLEQFLRDAITRKPLSDECISPLAVVNKSDLELQQACVAIRDSRKSLERYQNKQLVLETLLIGF